MRRGERGRSSFTSLHVVTYQKVKVILLKKAQTVVQKTSRKNVTSTVLIFSSFLSFLIDVMGGKITVNLKELH